MFARFDENPAMTLRVIKETKRYGRTDARTDGHTDGRTDNVKTVYPLQTKFAGGIKQYMYITIICYKKVCVSKREKCHCVNHIFIFMFITYVNTVKPGLNCHLKEYKKKVFKTDISLRQWSILQYF